MNHEIEVDKICASDILMPESSDELTKITWKMAYRLLSTYIIFETENIYPVLNQTDSSVLVSFLTKQCSKSLRERSQFSTEKSNPGEKKLY